MSTSSKSSKCGLTNKAAARAARMAHPPLRLRVGRHIVSSEKPRPSKIFRARTWQKTFFENIIDDHIHKVIVQCVCVCVYVKIYPWKYSHSLINICSTLKYLGTKTITTTVITRIMYICMYVLFVCVCSSHLMHCRIQYEENFHLRSVHSYDCHPLVALLKIKLNLL